MLVLSRRIGEKIDIGDGLTVTVLRVTGKSIRLGIEAPDSVSIRRSEITVQNSWPVPPESSSGNPPAIDSANTESRFS